jgi:hypothetical protein
MNDLRPQEYFRWFYDQGVRKRMHYRGVRFKSHPRIDFLLGDSGSPAIVA